MTGRALLTAEQMRADIATFRSEFLARVPSFTPPARAQAEERLRRLEAALVGMTPVAFELELSRIVALADNAHTLVGPVERARRHNRISIRLVPFGDDFYVLRATNANADLLGARLLSIDGHLMRELRDSARALVGGTPAWRDRLANFLLESPEQLNALGLSSNATHAVYTFQTVDGRVVDRELTGERDRPPEPYVLVDRWLFPELLPGEDGRWRALQPGQTPGPFDDVGAPFRWRAVPKLDLLVIEFRRNSDARGRRIADFLSEVTREILSRQPRNLAVDMRLNGGGNLQTTRAFMSDLPRLVPGRIFALTSPWTFSAAISSIGYLEQAAPDRVTIVGEEIGDRLEFWAEERWMSLPNSGIRLVYGAERHDYRTGCRPYADCHPPVAQYPIAVATLAPDIRAPWTIEAYRAGRDPGMEAVIAELRRRR